MQFIKRSIQITERSIFIILAYKQEYNLSTL